MKKICIQCGKEFELSDQEISYYQSKNLEIPKRCAQCRKRNRIKNNSAPTVQRKRLITNVNGRPKLGFGGNPMTGFVMILVIVFAVIFNGHFRGNNTNKTDTSDTKNATTVQDNSENTAQTDDAVSGDTDSGKKASGTSQETLTFRSWKLLEEHFEKHGEEVGCSTAEEYLAAANAVVANRKSLHKTEKEDGDDVYFLESTGEFVIVSTDGYIRTYYKPEDGIRYYNRQ